MERNTIALIAIIVTLCGYIIYDRLTRNREKISRHANSCNEFRNSILNSVSHIPKADKYWDNVILESMPNVICEIELAVEKFKVYLLKKNRESFEKEWLSLKKHIERIIPKALSKPELMYGGGTATAKDTKEKFHERLQKLLQFAEQT